MTHAEIKSTGKVKKVHRGRYIYVGNNFDVELFDNLDGLWVTDKYNFVNKTNIISEEQIEWATNSYDYTKGDLVGDLKRLDIEITNPTAFLSE